jgi:hypothetical protein
VLTPTRRRRRLAGLLAAGVVATLAVAPGPAGARTGPAPSAAAPVMTVPTSVAQGKWAAIATQGYDMAVAAYNAKVAAGQPIQTQHVAAIVNYLAQTYGWTDSRTVLWLSRLHDLKLGTGGYGLNLVYNGRSATTTYTITTAFHVGLTLLDGYDHGALPASDLTDAARALLAITQNAGGGCIDYSNAAQDVNQPCIYNVSAAAALFLNEVLKRNLAVPGYTVAQIQSRITAWATFVRNHYRADIRSWDYSVATHTPYESDHVEPVAEAMYLLPASMGGMGYQAVEDFMFNFSGEEGAYQMTPFYCANADIAYATAVAHLNTARTQDVDHQLSIGAGVAITAPPIQAQCATSTPTGLFADAVRPMLVYPSMTDAYNNNGVTSSANGSAAGFDDHGDTYDYRQLPAGGTEIHHGSLFIWPTLTPEQNDNIRADGRVIAMPNGTRIGLLAAVAGGATSVRVVVYYSDGTTSYIWYSVPPWANSTKPTSPDLIADTVGNFGRTGFAANGVHYDIFYVQAATVAGKTVTAIAVPFAPTVHIFDAVPA